MRNSQEINGAILCIAMRISKWIMKRLFERGGSLKHPVNCDVQSQNESWESLSGNCVLCLGYTWNHDVTVHDVSWLQDTKQTPSANTKKYLRTYL